MKEGIGFLIGLIGIIIDIVWAFNTGKIALLVIGSIFIGIGYHLLGLDKIFGKKKDKTVSLKPNQQIGQVIYSEREIPDDSAEALEIKQKIEKEGNEIYNAVVSDIESSGFFKPEMIAELEERIEGIKHGDKWKIPNEEMEKYFSALGLKQKYPREILNNIYYQNFHKVNRRRDLERMKAAGIRKVEILDCGDERDCSKIKRLKKVWPIDQLPDLPLPGCTAKYCRCSFIAHDILE